MTREIITYSREELEHMAKQYAKMKIIGPMFIGDFHDQKVKWHRDGSIEVITSYTGKQV